MVKETIIISLIVLAIYLYYQQNNLATAPVESLTNPEIQELKTQVNYYQTLYQKRVAKDLETDQSAQIQQLTLNNQQLESNLSQATQQSNLFQQKVGDLETQLINLAKQKVKGKKDAEILLNDLETNWSKKEID